jgi:hypothetical protein
MKICGGEAPAEGARGVIVADFNSRIIIPSDNDGDMTYYKRRSKEELLPLVGGTGMKSLRTKGQRHIYALFLICLVTAGLCAQEQKLEPIPIQLPKPPYSGTPANIDWTNVEKPSSKPRGSFLAPAGVVNVAKGKKVVSSEKEPLAGDLEMITDGDKKQADYSCVTLGPGLQHVTIDLGAMHNVYAVLFWH